MSRIPTKLIAVAASSAVAAGGAGAIVNANAAKPAHKAKTAHTKKHGKRRGGALRRAVHADLTVPTKDGFKDVTVDRGFLTSASGGQLTINESTKKLTNGKSVTVTVPSDAKVRVDRKAAQLSDLKPGQHVAVLTLPKKTVVRAVTR